jgi:hypothetical protein
MRSIACDPAAGQTFPGGSDGPGRRALAARRRSSDTPADRVDRIAAARAGA